MKPPYKERREMFQDEIDRLDRKIETRRKRIADEEKGIAELEKEKEYFWDMVHELNVKQIAELDAKGLCRFCEFKLPEHHHECGRKNG